jgi:hypothetical integral membrane protein (TIGR02206 family)
LIAAARAEYIPYFDTPHNIALALALLVPAALAWWVRRDGSEDLPRKVGCAMALFLVANEIAYRTFHGFTVETVSEYLELSLPLHICPLALCAGCIALWRRSQVAYEIVYFWGLVGTVNGLLMPDIVWRFPSCGFIGYFTSHGGVLWVALYATWGLGMRPTWRSVGRSFLLLNATALVLGLVNLAIGGDANYAFVCAAPDVDHPLIQGGWPWYMLVLEVVGILLFAVAYLPFYFSDILRRRRTGDNAE